MSFVETLGGIKNLSNGPDIAFQLQDNGLPWPSVASAHAGTPEAYRAIGKIRWIDIGDGKGMVEYWYKGGISQSNLVPRYENLESAQSYVTELNALKNAAELANENAGVSEVNALNYMNAAALSADSALIQSGSYTTEALGRAAVADGENFKVQGSGEVAAYEYKRISAGESQLITTWPSKQALNQFANFPFDATITPNVTLKAAIKKASIEGVFDLTKKLTFGVLRRNVTVSAVPNTWEIKIFDYTSGTFGAAIYTWSKVNYTPTTTVEQIAITGTGIGAGTTFYVTVDWSQVPDATELQGMTFSSGGLSNQIVNNKALASQSATNDALALEVQHKNYPFSPEAVPNATVKSAVKQIAISSGFDRTKKLNIAVFQRNASTTWRIAVYDYTAGSNGTIAGNWQITSYTPSANVETLTLPGTGIAVGSNIYITIDWTAVPDGTNLSSLNGNIISALTIMPIVPDQSIGTSKIPDLAITEPKLSTVAKNKLNNFRIQNPVRTPLFTESTTVASNTGAPDQSNAWAGIIELTFVQADQTFNGFAFPGRSFAGSNIYAVAIVYAAGVFQEIQIQDFDSRTSDYTFYFSRSYNRQENISIRFGFATSTMTSVNVLDAGGWARNETDANLAVSPIRYVGSSSSALSIFSASAGGGANWKSSRYKLINNTKVVFQPASTSFVDGSIVKAKLASAVQAELHTFGNPYSIILPPKIHMLSGSSFWYYDDAIVKSSHIYEKAAARITLEARKASDNSLITPYAYQEGFGKINANADNYNLTFKVNDYWKADQTNVPEVRAILTTQVITTTRPTGVTKGVLAIADSYFDNKYGDGVQEYIQQFAAADGNTIIWGGPRTSHGQPSMAFASRNENFFWDTYVPTSTRADINAIGSDPNHSSPFVFSTDDTPANRYFSFSQYLTTYSQTAPDVIVFFLGMNGGLGTNINNMIANIRSTHPAIKFVVCMVPGAEKARDNFDSITRQLGRIQQNESYITLFQNREAEGIKICPINMMFHRVYALANGQQEQVQFNENGVPTKTVNVDHHPNATGAKGGIAYPLYNYIFSF